MRIQFGMNSAVGYRALGFVELSKGGGRKVSFIKDKSMNSIMNVVTTFLLVGLFLISFGFAAVSEEQIAAEECILSSEVLMGELVENSYAISRVNDTLDKAKVVYEAQEFIAQRGMSAKFDTVIEYCDEVSEVYTLAIDSRDSYNVLMEFYELSLTERMNKSTIDTIIIDIESEIESERYERVAALVERAYDEIGVVQKRETALNAFYGATTRGLKVFFLNTWKPILIGLGVFMLIMIFYGTAIRRIMTKRKIRHLEARRLALKNYLKKTQRLYFDSGKLSESEYELRSKNFAEMVREIDRQIPLLNEKLIRYGRKVKNEKKAK